MFNASTNSSSQNHQLNVNTNLFTAFGDNCMIKLGAWNLQLSLKFYPVKGVNPQTGLKQYAQNGTEIISTSLTADNCETLIKGIDTIIKPAIEKGEQKSIGIPISSGENAKTITIATDGNDVSITIAIGVDEEGKTSADKTLSLTFKKKVYYEGYNPVSGGGTAVKVESEFENFYNTLKDIRDIKPATAHSIKYNTALASSFQNRAMSNSQTNNMNTYSAEVSTTSLDDVFN